MTVEYIQVDGGDHGIAERILLKEKAGFAAGFGIVPGAPFIDREGKLVAGIMKLEDRHIVTDKIFLDQGMRQRRNPLILPEADRRTLVLPILLGQRVVVKR